VDASVKSRDSESANTTDMLHYVDNEYFWLYFFYIWLAVHHSITFLLLPTWYTNFLFIHINYIKLLYIIIHMYNLRRWPPDDGRIALETCRGI